MTLDEMWRAIQGGQEGPRRDLTPQQLRILNAGSGPSWVIAGPGSGKTETLALRCLRLIYVDGVNPRSVIVTTFTEKAARELQDRITIYSSLVSARSRPEDIQDIDVTHVRVGTLHSMCNDVLQEYRHPSYQNIRLMDEFEQLIFINEHSALVRRRPQPGSEEEALWEAFVGLIGGWATQSAAMRMGRQLNRAIGFRNLVGRIVEYRVDVAEMRRAGQFWPTLATGYDDYCQKLQDLRRSDFSHVQKAFLEFLDTPKGNQFLVGEGSRENPGVLHVLVDEYQDTNPIQEAIYFRLAAAHNLMVVGDDDQAIYRFRGGTVDSLITFNESCRQAWQVEDVEPLPLYDNFRSHRRIVDWCNRYIAALPAMQLQGARAPGKLALEARSRVNDLGDYPAVALISGPRLGDLARVFAMTVRELLDSGTVSDPSDCALLLRSTRQTRNWARPYVDALRQQGVEAFNPRSGGFMDQDEVQVALGAFIGVVDPNLDACPAQLNRTVQPWRNAYQAAIATGDYQELEQYVQRARAQIASKGSVVLLNTNVMELFYILLSFAPFRDWQQNIEASVRLAKLTQILEAYTAMPQPDQPTRTRNWLATSEQGGEVSRRWRGSFYWGLCAILEAENLGDEEDEYISFPRGRLPVMTIFQAKGLQFPFVFVGTSSDDAPNVSGTQLAEDLLFPFRIGRPRPRFTAAERAQQDYARLFYVAHSRAQYGLVILATYDQQQNNAPHLGPGGWQWLTDQGSPDLTNLAVD